MKNLNEYFNRIGFDREPQVDIATLKDLQRLHLLNIPYENLDVQLTRRTGIGIDEAFHKIVTRNRGGWCYEMNGVLGWALEEIGFDVMYMSGGVARSLRGDSALGNHLVLLVILDGVQWLTDVGFGDGFIEPIPMSSEKFEQRGFGMSLEPIEDGYWRFHNHQFGGAPDFDFRLETADQKLLAAQCERLQTDPESTFVQVLVIQQFNKLGYDIQIGPVAKTIKPDGVEQRVLESAEEFQDRLGDVFGIQDSELGTLWLKTVDAYERFIAKQSQ